MTALAIFLLRLLGRLPFAARRRLGAILGDAARLLGIRRRIAARNLQLTFPELSAAERHAILRRHFQLLGAVLLDEFALLTMSENAVNHWLSLAEDTENQRPIIFCVPHFVGAGIGGIRLSANWGGRLIFHYKPMHDPHWDAFYKRLRGKCGAIGVKATETSAMRVCARHLQQNKVMFYLPDTDTGTRKSMVFAPFLGVSAATTTTVSRLAAIAGAQVRMFMVTVTDNGYKLHLSPPLDNFPGPDLTADAGRLNALIGEQVRRDPAQYYWLHRRFKTRPAGEKNCYA